MVELNPQALLAALEANHAHKADPGRKGCGIEKAIRAYLSAIPAPDDGLVGRLRYRVENPSAWDSFDQGGSDLCREAATALQYQAEQIERLTRERDIALENYTRAWNERDAQRRRAEAAEQQVQKLIAENERLRKKNGQLHDYANMRDTQVVGLTVALEEMVDSLTPAEHASERDPLYGSEVRSLGIRIGFGALMSSASTEWRLWLEENGYPLGGEFVSGPCRGVLQSDLRRARSALETQEGGK